MNNLNNAITTFTQKIDNIDPPEFLSTHPSHESREKNLAALVPEALKIRNECGCYRLPNQDPYIHFEKFVAEMRKQAEIEKKRAEIEKERQKPRIIIVGG